MQCDQCHEQPATIFVTTVIDGEKTERKLCAICGGPMLTTLPKDYEDQAREALEGMLDSSTTANCPAEITIPEPISVDQLATVLGVPAYRIIAILIKQQLFTSVHAELDFTTAELICKHYGVTAHLGSMQEFEGHSQSLMATLLKIGMPEGYEEQMRAEVDRILSQPANCPAEITITDPISVNHLAEALGLQSYHVIGVLIEKQQIFKSEEDLLDFTTASLVCQHFGITAHLENPSES